MRFQLKKSLTTILLSGAVSVAMTACASADTVQQPLSIFKKPFCPFSKTAVLPAIYPAETLPMPVKTPLSKKRSKKTLACRSGWADDG